ncbi:exopolysaccharide biosynthesis polyprenyl glycosylphosphotransferase [Lutibacter sp.]
MPKKQLPFSISERKVYLRFLDIVFIIAGLFVLSKVFDNQYFSFNNQNIYLWLLVLIIYYYFFAQVFEMYNLKVASDKYLTLRSLVITVIFTSVFYVFTPVLSPELPQNRIQILYFILTLLIFVFINRFIYIQFIFSPRFLKNILLIGDTNTVKSVLRERGENESNRIVGYISDTKLEKYSNLKFSSIKDTNIENLVTSLGINEILVSTEVSNIICKKMNTQLIALFEKGISIKSIDNFLEHETFKISESQLTSNFYNYFSFSKSHQNNLYLAFRRIADIVFAVIGMVFLIILIPLVVVTNLVANKGSLFYFQTRVGNKGEVFEIIKFRTMIANAEKNGAVWAQKNDTRITSFGRILRKSRIDEVPQFLNVLKGDMSLIGPRPERPEFVEKLEKELPYYALRHVIKPGLTGWAQVMHPYANTVEDQRKKLMFDLYYIKERNLIMDLKIVIKTISTILFFRGT